MSHVLDCKEAKAVEGEEEAWKWTRSGLLTSLTGKCQ